MKILYLSSGQSEDYQCDALFHGLRQLVGPDAVDVNRISSLYIQPDDVKNTMYGRGYTLYDNLADIDVDREKIEARIQSGYFDFVIFGSIWRCQSYLQIVLHRYPPSRVIFVDGEDETRVRWSLLGKGVYFKRELEALAAPYIHPIHFAVPSEKFISDQLFEDNLWRKSRPIAPCDPRDRSTYVFMTESSYYRQYQEAYFGITMKKAGWDCMRHHEIVAQGTAPYFLELENCPAGTLHLLPRFKIFALRTLLDEDPQLSSQETRYRYNQLMRELFQYYKQHFTTVALAEYVLRVTSDCTDIDRAGMPRMLQMQQMMRNARRSGAVAVRRLRRGEPHKRIAGPS